jgi:hypothetical protein
MGRESLTAYRDALYGRWLKIRDLAAVDGLDAA